MAEAARPTRHYDRVPALVDPPGRHRGDLLVQRRPFANRLAGLLDAVVDGRPHRLDPPRPADAGGARPDLQAGDPRGADIGPDRDAVRERDRPAARTSGAA